MERRFGWYKAPIRPCLGMMLSLGTAIGGLAAGPQPLAPGDVLWLNRLTYGLDSATVQRYEQLGRKGFLEEQLHPDRLALPPEVRDALADSPSAGKPLAQQLEEVELENQRINALPEEDRRPARQAQNQAGNGVLAEAARRHLLRALWSPAQVQEQMTWFWLNHFSVFQGKGNLRWTIGDYEERAIRPHALGRFRDLVMATLTHPAMLVYLDNARSAAGRINENYARELLELHTLGVDGGYSQQDVQELARVLTGVGVATLRQPRLKAQWAPLYRREDGFEFNPARHDFGEKLVLGMRIPGEGFHEVERVVDLVSAHPSTARFISRKLGAYWLGADPSPALLESMSKAFLRNGGDIPSVLTVLFASREFEQSLGHAFKDPMHFVASALRLAYDGKRPLNMKPVMGWLNALGEPLYGHLTPDGYPAAAQAWSSPGQMAKRFEIARAIGSGNAGLFAGDDGSPSDTTGFPQLSNRLYYGAVEPLLSPGTRAALDRAGTQQEWNTFLLSSPDFMFR